MSMHLCTMRHDVAERRKRDREKICGKKQVFSPKIKFNMYFVQLKNCRSNKSEKKEFILLKNGVGFHRILNKEMY